MHPDRGDIVPIVNLVSGSHYNSFILQMQNLLSFNTYRNHWFYPPSSLEMHCTLVDSVDYRGLLSNRLVLLVIRSHLRRDRIACHDVLRSYN